MYLGLYIVAMGAWSWSRPAQSFEAWHDRVADPWFAAGLMLFFAALMLHAWVGARDIVMDYVRPLGLRLGLLVFVGISLSGFGLWAARVVLLAGAA